MSNDVSSKPSNIDTSTPIVDRNHLPVATVPLSHTIDEVYVMRLCDDLNLLPDSAEIQSYLATFEQHCSDLITQLLIALSDADLVAVGRLAHTIHGGAALLGARVLALHCGELEAQARQKDCAQTSRLAAELPDLLTETTTALRRLTLSDLSS